MGKHVHDDLDAVLFPGRLRQGADGGGRHSVAADDAGHVRLFQNQAEADGVSLRILRNAQFRLFRMLHALQSDQLQVLADLFYGRMHEGKCGLFPLPYYKTA